MSTTKAEIKAGLTLVGKYKGEERSLPRFPGQFRCRDYAASVSVVSLRS